MKKISYKYLNIISFEDIDLWDVKRYLYNSNLKINKGVLLSDILYPYKENISKDDVKHNKLRIIAKINFSGDLFLREFEEVETYKGNLNLVPKNAITYSKINVRHGCIYFNDSESVPFAVSNEYPVFKFDEDKVDGNFLQKLLRTKEFKKLLDTKTTGISKARVKQGEFLNIKIPLPSLAEQEAIVNAYENKIKQADQLEKQADQLETEIESYLFSELGVSFQKYEKNQSGKLYFVGYKDLDNWVYNSLEKHFYDDLNNSIYPINTIGKIFNFISRSWKKKVNERREYIELGSIDSDFGILETKTISAEKAPSRATQIVKTGDLIIGTTRPYLKKFAIIDKKQNGFVASSGFSIIEENKDKYNLYFLNEVIKSQIGMYQFDIKVTGALYPAITQTELESLKIPIPPLEKQQEIVDYISALKVAIKDKKNTAQQLKYQAQTDFENQIFN